MYKVARRSALFGIGGVGFLSLAQRTAVAQVATVPLVPPSPNWSRAMPPAPDARVKVTDEYANRVGADAYFWCGRW